MIEEFARHELLLSSEAPVTVVIEGKQWSIADESNGPFSLILSAEGEIAVFLEADLAPANLADALCVGTLASSAMLAGVSLRGVRWYGAPATLDHADLEGASLQDSLLVETDFTGAFVSGADFSGAILIGAQFRGCTISSGSNHQPTAFERAQLQGVDFGQSAVLSAGLYKAGVATSDGVPLLRLPCGGEDPSLPAIVAALEGAGYPLGENPTIEGGSQWLLDNSADPNGSSPRSYHVETVGDQLAVFDDADGRFLFYLDAKFIATLDSGVVDAQLQSAGERLAIAARTLVRIWDTWRFSGIVCVEIV